MILVGGGSILIDCSRPLKGVSQLIRPPHSDVSCVHTHARTHAHTHTHTHSPMVVLQVANAVGAALGQISGTVDHIVTIDKDNPERSRAENLERTKQMAIDAAVEAGAVRSTVSIMDVTEVPLQYLGSTGVATRMKVKAVGDLEDEDSVEEKPPDSMDTTTEEKQVRSVECLGLWILLGISNNWYALGYFPNN